MIKKILKNKITIVLIVAILGASYYLFGMTSNQAASTTYLLEKVGKGNIIHSIDGTGQVSSYNEAVVNTSVEGNVTSLNIKLGDEVVKNQVIAVVDAKEAQEDISTAEDALESAQLSLEKTKRGLRDEELEIAEMGIENQKKDIVGYEDDLVSAKEDAEDDLAKVKKDAQTALNNNYDNLIAEIKTATNESMTILSSITDIQTAHFNDNTQEGIKIASAKAAIVKDLLDLNDGGRATNTTINKATGGIRGEVAALQETKDKTKAIELYSDIKDILKRLKQTLEVIPIDDTLTASEKSSISSNKSTIESRITSLDNKKQAVVDQQETNDDNIKEQIEKNEDSIEAVAKKIEDAKTSLTESEKQLSLKVNVDPYEIQTQETNIKQKEKALADAKEKLADYYIKAPFDGIVGTVSIELGNYVSKGTSIATVITKQQIAEITLNEVDIVNVKVGQKATFTFDAIDDLSVTGEVVEVGLVGSVSQGVVSYPVKIVLNDSDERIKSGMSTSVSIIVSFKQDVIMIPASAIKTANNSSYVLSPSSTEKIDADNLSTEAVVLNGAPEQIAIEVGETTDDYVEVVSGLEEGDVIVANSVTTKSTTTSSQGQSLFNFGGGGMRTK